MSHLPKLRFAPSPTGWLHVGNVRTALVNWLFARKTGGAFLLRLDDTDLERSRPEYEEGIREDLRWLGLEWDEEARQIARMERYREAEQKLIEAGRLYPCYETAEELEFRRKLQTGRGQPPIYDRAALKLTDAQKRQYEQEGRTPHWRFLLKEEDIAWDDLIRGAVAFHGTHVSDPVLVREDGVPLYTLSSVVDDGEMAITHVVRGEDHVSNTAVQVQLFEALGFPVPQFAHMALLVGKGGKLSKREGGGDIRSLRAKGYFPLAITSYLAKIGTSDPIELAENPETLAQAFDFAKMGRSAAQYDEEELSRLNTKLLHGMAFEEVRSYLAACTSEASPSPQPSPQRGDCRTHAATLSSSGEKELGGDTGEGIAPSPLGERVGVRGSAPHALPEQIDEPFWLAIRENISSLAEIEEWLALIHQPVTPVIEDAEYCRAAAELIPEEWSADVWSRFTAAVKEKTGRKGKELFMPLRLALTARADGPELKTLFFLLGREKAQKRLRGEKA